MEYLFLDTRIGVKPGGFGACDPRRPALDLRRDLSRPLSRQSDLPLGSPNRSVQAGRCIRSARTRREREQLKRLGRTAGQNETVGAYADI